MMMHRRHVALLFAALALLSLALLAPRGRTPARRAPPPATAALPEIEAPAAATAAATAQAKPDLLKKAHQALSRSKPPITAAASSAGGPARFVLRDGPVSAFFTPQGITLSLLGRMDGKRPDPTRKPGVLNWGIAGARPVDPRPEGEQEARVHVLKGPEADWKADQKTYSRVVYDEVKPGVDMIVETASHGVKYTLGAAKASDVAALRLRYEGAGALRATDEGKALEISVGEGRIREDGLVVTQEGRPIEASYQVTGPDEYAIVLHGADPEKPVEVDPLVGWSSFLGGTLAANNGTEYGYCVEVDGANNMYVAGVTFSADVSFTTVGAYDRSIGGNQDGFVVKIRSDGVLMWCTYLGGTSYDEIRGIAIDGSGNVYATGYTNSADFPRTPGAVDPDFANAEAFVTRINAAGTAVDWSTFLGGESSDYGTCIRVDSTGANVWVAGYTYSTSFPVEAGFDPAPATMPDGFITKLDGNGTNIVWSSYVGGNSDDQVEAMVVDSTGAAYLTGTTYSTDLPLAGTPFRNFNSGSADVFVVKVKPLATALEWGTYVGGTSYEEGKDIAVDGLGHAYITGYTYSANYPTVAGGVDTSHAGGTDVFLTKLNPSGSGLIYSVFLGGSDYEYGHSVVVDSAGQAVVTGYAYSATGFPIGPFPPNPNGPPFDTTHNGGADIFVTKFAAAANFMVWSGWIGGTDYEYPYAMAIDAANNLYLTGATYSTPAGGSGFPMVNAFNSTLGGGEDSFLIRLAADGKSLGLSTYIGGDFAVGDDYGRKVAVDSLGNIYVTGITYSQDFPTQSPGQSFLAGSGDATITKFSNLASPTLVWSTFIGGSSDDEPIGIGVDPTANPATVYIGALTYSLDWPTVGPQAILGGSEIVVSKITSTGNGLVWSRYLGGSSSEYPQAMAVSSVGDVAVVGYTYSSDFPTSVFNSYQSALSTGPDAFIARLQAADGTLGWSTYYGGNSDDYAQGVAFNAAGTLIYATGLTYSTNLPMAGASYQNFQAGGVDLWFARFNPAALNFAQLQLSSYLGSPDYEDGPSIDVDASGDIYLAGVMRDPFFLTSTGPAFAGSQDVLVAKFLSTGALSWSRFLGGSSTEYPTQIKVDAAQSPYVIGYTYSIDFPVPGAFQSNLAGNSDVFIAKIDLAGGSLDWASYLGGSSYESAFGLALGSGGTAYLVGETTSANFPTFVTPPPPLPPSFDNALNGYEMFVTRIDNSTPATPTSLSQLKLAGTPALAVGAWSNETGFIARATTADLDGDTCAIQVELKPKDVAFDGTNLVSSTFDVPAQRTVTVTFPATPSQEFHWRIRTIDVNGKTSSWASFGGNADGVRDVGHDSPTGPTVTTSTPTTGTTYTTATSPISFSGGATDNLSGVASVAWVNRLLPSLTVFSSGNATGSASWSVPSIALSPGGNQITFTATDNAGNTGTKVVTVTYDTAAPTTTITGPTSAITYLTGTPSGPPVGSLILTGTATDGFEVASVSWTNGGASGGGTFTGGTPTNRTWQAVVALSPGTNPITITCFDGANNFHSDSITVTYDNTAPSVNIATAPFTTVNLTADLTGSASDPAPNSGIASVTWLNTANGSTGNAALTLPNWTITGIPLAAGANLITVTANDGVVNNRTSQNSAATSITLTRDNADPVVSILSPTPSAVPPGFITGNASIAVNGSATDDLNVASVTWINPSAGINTPQPATLSGPVTNRTWNATVTLAGGDNLITFTATDGVLRTHQAQTYIRRQTTAPTLTVGDPAAATTVTDTSPRAMSGTASAAMPATLASVTVRNTTTGVFATVVGTTSWSADVALVIGTNTIEVTATDSVPISTVVTRTIILDPTDPVVTITGPTGADTYASPVNTVVLSGVASDNRGVESVTWENVTAVTGEQPATVDGPAASPTWTTPAINLLGGANTILVRARDEAGNLSTDTITVTYDTTTPGITITSPTSAPATTTTAVSVALGGNASDNFLLQSVTWINATTTLSGPVTPPLAAWSTPLIPLNPGTNVITVIAVDSAGNSQTDTITVFRDDAAPVVTITSPTSDPSLSTATATIALGGTASDDVQVAQVGWSVAPGGQSGTATGAATWSIASIPLAAGSNTITVTATDGAGRSSNDAIVVSYDPTAPSIAIGVPAANPFSTTTTPLILQGTAGDNIGVTEIVWTNATTGGTGAASGTATWNTLVPLTSGTNLLSVTSFDAAGNSATDTVTVVYDPAAPVIDITSPTSALSIVTNTTPLTIAGTASDDVGVASVTWTTSGSVAVTGGTATGTDAWSFSVVLAAGENVITVTATDGVGRTGTSFLTVVFDPTSPTVSITVPTSDPTFLTTQATLNIAGSANDNLSLQSLTWSNAATGASGATQGLGAWSIPSVALNEGPNLITVTATDSVNNSGNSQITVTYDGTNPVVAITPPAVPDVLPGGPPYVTSTRPFPLAGTASDNLGLAGVSWTNSLGGNGNATVSSGTWTAAIYLQTGVNTITVTATDDHGRIAVATIDITFSPEGTAPLISFTTPPGPTAATSTQLFAVAGAATDNVGVTAVTWRNATTRVRGDAVDTAVVPAAPFSTWTASIPLINGPNVLVATAVDDAGNTVTATVTVTFTPATPDASDPLISITSPANPFAAPSSPVTVAVSAFDDVGVAAVYWANSGTGGDGAATPGAAPAWSATIGLALGTNVITLTAVDVAGNTATDTLVVTFTPAAPDGNAPIVTIVSPPTGATYNTSVGTVTLTGTASDATAVAAVVWVNGTIFNGGADGTTAWSADIPLQAGINLITVRAYDVYGLTDNDTLTVLYTPPPPPPEVVPAGSCGLLGLDAVALLLALAAWRRRRARA